MSIDDDIALLKQAPTLRLLGHEALRNLAFGTEPRELGRGEFLFRAGERADSGFVVQSGSFRISREGEGAAEVVAQPGDLIGELALLRDMPRPSSAVAIEPSTAIRISRSLFQRVLEGHPDAAARLRNHLAARTSQLASEILLIGGKLS